MICPHLIIVDNSLGIPQELPFKLNFVLSNHADLLEKHSRTANNIVYIDALSIAPIISPHIATNSPSIPYVIDLIQLLKLIGVQTSGYHLHLCNPWFYLSPLLPSLKEKKPKSISLQITRSSCPSPNEDIKRFLTTLSSQYKIEPPINSIDALNYALKNEPKLNFFINS